MHFMCLTAQEIAPVEELNTMVGGGGGVGGEELSFFYSSPVLHQQGGELVDMLGTRS